MSKIFKNHKKIFFFLKFKKVRFLTKKNVKIINLKEFFDFENNLNLYY